VKLRVPHAPERGADGYFHPASEAELCALVRFARREGRKLRVRGSAHSTPQAVYADPATMAARERVHVDIMLDRYTHVEFNATSRQVTVEAGCHLGRDPRDPTQTSTWENSLSAQLDARGWALPDLGGVTHQTVSGFLMTGSRGGSVRHAFESSVVAMRMVDGLGETHELVRDRDPLFFAALCSMGLLGVVSTLTLQCEARFDIIGQEDSTPEHSCAFGLFADGEDGLEVFLHRSEYARLMWWPQEGVRRVVTWQARRMQSADYTARTGARGALTPKRYYALGDIGLGPTLTSALNQTAQVVGGLFYDAVAQAERTSRALPWRSPLDVRSKVRSGFARQILPRVLRHFVHARNTQAFWDSWYEGLPLDNQMLERSLPTDFTEIWVPLDRAGEVMRAMRRHYDRQGYDATGAFICEVYAARASRSWMHPGFERDSLRIDLFWFRRNPSDPRASYYVQFWELLQEFAYRLHWGKHLPRSRALGAVHLRANMPRWDDFLAARAELDPEGVFLTPYWRDALGVGTG
jgi:FAD/FMN-containing dehydrogenase